MNNSLFLMHWGLPSFYVFIFLMCYPILFQYWKKLFLYEEKFESILFESNCAPQVKVHLTSRILSGLSTRIRTTGTTVPSLNKNFENTKNYFAFSLKKISPNSDFNKLWQIKNWDLKLQLYTAAVFGQILLLSAKKYNLFL